MTKKNTVFLIRVIVFVILTIPIAAVIIGIVVAGVLGCFGVVFAAYVYSLLLMPVFVIIGIFIIILISCKRLKSDIAELEQELEKLEESEEE
ncbi:MAG: hypothetical protein FWG83_06535 [Oscillospiraceae bacterium]|nr:hypothetical protein [Oscillospiraceae bacterium]